MAPAKLTGAVLLACFSLYVLCRHWMTLSGEVQQTLVGNWCLRWRLCRLIWQGQTFEEFLLPGILNFLVKLSSIWWKEKSQPLSEEMLSRSSARAKRPMNCAPWCWELELHLLLGMWAFKSTLTLRTNLRSFLGNIFRSGLPVPFFYSGDTTARTAGICCRIWSFENEENMGCLSSIQGLKASLCVYVWLCVCVCVLAHRYMRMQRMSEWQKLPSFENDCCLPAIFLVVFIVLIHVRSTRSIFSWMW